MSRIVLTGIVAFWLVMNFLLWRSQASEHSGIGSAVPVQVVWEKILTAPDNSSLEIYDHTNKIGFCHWMATVGDSPLMSNKSLSEDYAPDGHTAPPPSGYTLNLEGNTSLGATNRLRVRFEFTLRLSTNQSWQDFHFRASMHPNVWDVRATAATQRILLNVNDDTGHWQRAIKFSELEHPESLLQEFDGGYGLSLLAGQTGSLGLFNSATHWDAHDDWMRFGHSRVRVFRLETHFFGQRISVFISRAGEILWVEAPGGITLRNEAFSHF